MKRYIAMAVAGASTVAMLAGPMAMNVHAQDLDDRSPSIELREKRRDHWRKFKKDRRQKWGDKDQHREWKELRKLIQNATPEQLPEIQRAVETRETAKIEAYKAKTSAAVDALEAKKDSLVEAWGIEDADERQEALKEARQEFKESKREVRKTFRESVKEAYTSFVETLKGIFDFGSDDDSDDES